MFSSVFSQVKTKEYFIAKSKKQKAVAWTLLGTGAAAIISGAIIDNSNKGEEQSYTGGFMEIGGVICTLTSIPFFISSHRNKKRAATLTMNSQKILLPLNNSFVLKTRPALALRIAF